MAAGVQRPFLKWAGGKFRVLPHILQALPDGKRLIEPFVGSGALFLNTDYRSYQLADINPDLINLYQTLQKDGANFIDYAARYFSDAHNAAEKFYFHRERFNQLSVEKKRQQKEKAALFLYLNRHGYNGLCRYNSNGMFNVPFGRFKRPYFPIKEMLAFHLKAQNAEFVCSDFRQVMAGAKRGDVVYCDPPYVPLSKTASFTAYSFSAFNTDAQVDLARHAEGLMKKKIPVLISNHDTIDTRQLYKVAYISRFQVKRLISCNGSSRDSAAELLAHYAI